MQRLPADILRAHKGVSFPGVAVLCLPHDGRGRFMLAKRSANARDEHGNWSPVAGGVKHGQSITENLERELMEEHAIQAKRIDPIGYFDIFRETPDGVKTHWIGICFAALVDPNQVTISEPDMIDEIGWFTRDTMPKPAHTQFEQFFAACGDELDQILARHD